MAVTEQDTNMHFAVMPCSSRLVAGKQTLSVNFRVILMIHFVQIDILKNAVFGSVSTLQSIAVEQFLVALERKAPP
jgi:hypothetical protein